MTYPICGARAALLLLFSLATRFLPTNGAFINFENCLGPGILNGQPLQLQWVPLFVNAHFQTESPYTLNLTYYGNVSGQQIEGPYPPPNDPSWNNPNITFGKIARVGQRGNGNFSTLFSQAQVLNYNAWDARASQFCPHLVNGECPLAPRFFANASDPSQLASFSVVHDFGSPYQFSTLVSKTRLVSGDRSAQDIACITANITPYLGTSIASLIKWLPAAILIIQGIAVLSAAIWSPWGSFDIFRWSSNYGRDEDLLRLVTPGFGDCLQYIQFVTLMGSLTLQYPGFFQPALRQTAWSLLLFNESFVTNGDGIQSLRDGIYVQNGTFGLSSMRRLIGMTSSVDVWACMAIWFAVIAAILIVLCQLGFLARWLMRVITKTSEEDLRRKNLPFTAGNMIRLLFNFFILPIVSLSLFQLVISNRSPSSVVGVAAVFFSIIIVGAGWILWVIFSTKPRTYLFDDMPTVLLYGPLYNTYSDSAAPFALVPVIITFMRAVAFGGAQPNGTAQIIILAICEVILITALNGFRPFQNQTSMNAYHTFFAIVRLITVLLSIAFIPAVGVSEAPRGWIGYIILLLHACVLVFGFFLNSAQTLIEVVARSAGLAGHDAQTGAARGSILGWRMLKKRQDRRGNADRASLSSNQAMLQTEDTAGGRSRSMSASSNFLLNRTPSTNRLSGGGFDYGSPNGDIDGLAYGSGPNGQGVVIGKAGTDGEKYYRPPRKRGFTNEELNVNGAKTRSISGPGLLYTDAQAIGKMPDSGRESPAPAYFRDRSDSGADNTRPDYAVREVDQYYRGQALSSQPTRKLRTGPTNPTGPAASAQSWFQRFMLAVPGNKDKEKEAGKGFEVVRSSRMPPEMQRRELMEDGLEMQTSPPMNGDLYQEEPYQDSPMTAQRSMTTARNITPQRAAFSQRNVQASPGAEGSNNLLDMDRSTSRSQEFGYDGLGRGPRVGSPMQNTSAIGNDAGHLGRFSERLSGSDSPVVSRNNRSFDLPVPTHTISRNEPDVSSTPHQSTDVGLGYITRPSGDTSRSSVFNAPSFGGDDDDEDHNQGSIGRSNRLSDPDPPILAPIEAFGGLDVPIPTISRFNSNRSGDQGLILQSRSNAYQPESYRQPAIPSRSSRRVPTLDQFHDHDNTYMDYEQDVMGRSNHYGGPERGVPQQHDVRPNSFFNTSRHRAADSITRNSFGANANLGSSAEFVAEDDVFARQEEMR